VRCNGNVRLDAMLELADGLGAGALATGHYARVDTDAPAPLLRTAADEGKDQSYVLCGLSPSSLARLRFPLGELHKPRVREIAREAGLSVAGRRDSQDLCFLAGTRSDAFLARHGGLRRRPGKVLDGDGRVLGEHAGAHAYTVGQRRGLQLSTPEPRFVLATDVDANTVTVGAREQLRTSTIAAREVTLHRPADRVDGVRVRAHGRLLRCTIEEPLAPGEHARVTVALDAPAERTAPGQLACLYAGDLVVGHGTIAA
jgi:tRNA-specific 2-thiouridylase